MSDSFLSQEEVDALLEGVTGERQKSDLEEVEEGAVRNYDISSQERIVRGRMPTMEIVNERFARNFRIGLFNFIRRSRGHGERAALQRLFAPPGSAHELQHRGHSPPARQWPDCV